MTHKNKTYVCVGTSRTASRLTDPANNIGLIGKLQGLEDNRLEVVVCSNKSPADVQRYLRSNGLKPATVYSAAQTKAQYREGVGSSPYPINDQKFWENMTLTDGTKSSTRVNPSNIVYIGDQSSALDAFKAAGGSACFDLRTQSDADVFQQIKTQILI